MDKRFKKIGGIDYKRGAIEYPTKLDASNRYHLYTKPFYNLANKISRWSGDGLDEDTQRHFCDFANMAYTLALPAGSRILDVGCGSGWLCEYFARLGYKVTGVDLSPELLAIARDRLNQAPYGADHETELSCRFVAHDIERAPLRETFDAIICYDSLHHFEDEHEVCQNIAAMLNYGGQLFVLEGERPPQGSEAEEELRSVMRRYETLESPFSREYLVELLRSHGFTIAGDYASVCGLVDRDNIEGNQILFVERPAFNYLLCKKVHAEGLPVTLCDSRNPSLLLANFSLKSEWTGRVMPAARIQVSFVVENMGDTLWLVSRAPLKGRVRIGSKILNKAQETIAEVHGDPPIQRAIAPGEKVTLASNWKAPERKGKYVLKIDLVDQEICWFEQHGSKPLLLPFEIT